MNRPVDGLRGRTSPGYASIGWTVAAIASAGIICFRQAQRGAPRALPAVGAAL